MMLVLRWGVTLFLALYLLIAEADEVEQGRKLFEWGRTFPGSDGPSYTVSYNCSHNGVAMCCGLMEENVLTPEIVPGEIGVRHSTCKITKKYIQSPYEQLHFEIATNLSTVDIWVNKKNGFINWVRMDVEDSNKWLERVRVHMQSETVPENHPDDLHYLSRFEVTKTCSGPEAPLSATWTEWIEPLTIHARHPFALRGCKNVYTWVELEKMKPELLTGLQGPEYVLVQSGLSIHEATSLSRHSHTAFTPHRNHRVDQRTQHLVTYNYMLDAGTSTFESSLRWFLCAYLQRKIVFDQDYGFEYTLLEPQDFWKRVPPSIRPVYHFFNAPVSNGTDNPTIVSPLAFIKEIAKPEDFVSFKLDIDTPEVEIPLALELAKSAELMGLVDEFFFELHFRCEVMMFCGWGSGMPAEFEGLKLERLSAMKLFRDLRMGGVRAHFWP